ncbi:MAG: hypothetical protein Q7U04_06620 [Bacteriovorax sp.]|nr:hypothetical protein [Bacteriovorax sp.]
MKSIVITKKILALLVLIFIILIIGASKTYFAQKKENSALRIKLLSQRKEKKKPIPWSRLSKESVIDFENKKNKNLATLPISMASIPNTMSEQSIEELADNLNQSMLGIKKLNLVGVEKNIAIADEIISREPNAYSAFKAKLISMIYKENKFNQSIDDYELNEILDSMATFETTNDSAILKEAALMASADYQVEVLENRLANISLERNELTSQLEGLEVSSSEYNSVLAQNDQLAAQEEALSLTLEGVVEGLDRSNTLSSNNFNEDIIEIPFMRSLAKGDFNTVKENAQSFIEQFPNSPIGYFYLVKTLMLEGQGEEVLKVIRESKLLPEVQNEIQNRLEATSGDDPKKYWEKLIF